MRHGSRPAAEYLTDELGTTDADRFPTEGRWSARQRAPLPRVDARFTVSGTIREQDH
jgi:hypothetical protein